MRLHRVYLLRDQLSKNAVKIDQMYLRQREFIERYIDPLKVEERKILEDLDLVAKDFELYRAEVCYNDCIYQMDYDKFESGIFMNPVDANRFIIEKFMNVVPKAKWISHQIYLTKQENRWSDLDQAVK